MTAVHPVGVCAAAAAPAVAAAGLPGAVMLAGDGLAMLAVAPETVPDRAALVRLAARATDAAGAFAPVLAPAQPAAALRAWMTTHGAGLAAALHRVAGAVEWIVVVPRREQALPAAVATGRAYLHALAAARRQDAAVLSRLHGIAAAIAPRAHRIAASGATVDLALLTSRNAVAATRVALGTAIAEWPGARVCGPFPPYGFCDLPPEDTP